MYVPISPAIAYRVGALYSGEAPVDSDSRLSGRVVGESKHPYSLLVDLSYSF